MINFRMGINGVVLKPTFLWMYLMKIMGDSITTVMLLAERTWSWTGRVVHYV